MNNMRNKILMTLALLITAVGGAWAQDIATPVISGETEFYDEVTVTITCATSEVDIYYTLDGSNPKDDSSSSTQKEYKKAFTLTGTTTVKAAAYSGDAWSAIAEVKFVKKEVTWDAATKTGTFSMPASDVVLTPIYAPTAVFATDGNQVLTPTAIEGIYAESTDAIVKAGTVAKIGETENVQGTLMYAVTSTNQATAPALSAFSPDVPTAKDITTAGDVSVWYYIKGADTPQGEEATAENTFNDSEICATPLTVTVLSNKFNIQFNAANANTIEAGKATVTVGGTAATVTEGKLEGVKMGSEVKMTAKEGYKFRKVKAEKVKTIKIDGQDYTVLNGETWSQFITRNQLSSWSVKSANLNTYCVCMDGGSAMFTLFVSSDGNNWEPLEFSPQDAPIDTDKQYKWD